MSSHSDNLTAGSVTRWSHHDIECAEYTASINESAEGFCICGVIARVRAVRKCERCQRLWMRLDDAETAAARLVAVICEQDTDPRCRTCGIRALREQIARDIEAAMEEVPPIGFWNEGIAVGLERAAEIARGCTK